MPPATTHRKNVKKGINEDDCRRRRETAAVEIRKQKREEGLAKRRNFASAPAEQSGTTPAHNLDNLTSYVTRKSLTPVFMVSTVNYSQQSRHAI